MTKLMEWLITCGSILIIWAAVVTNKIETPLTKQYMHLIIPSPVIFLLLFGVYAASVVLYRVFTFNNCEEAATELKKNNDVDAEWPVTCFYEIEMAKEDLKKKGYVF